MARLWTHLVGASALTVPIAEANKADQGMEVDAGSGGSFKKTNNSAFTCNILVGRW